MPKMLQKPSSPMPKVTSMNSMPTSTEGAPDFSSEDEYTSLSPSDSEGDDPANNFNPFLAVDSGQKTKKAEQVVKCCYENQRYWVVTGWGAMTGAGLERAGWSDSKGLFYLPKKSIKLDKGWRWAGPWMVEGREVRGS